MRTWSDVAAAELFAVLFVMVLIASAGSAYFIFRALHPHREDRLLVGAIASVAGPSSMALLASLALRHMPGQWPAAAYLLGPIAILGAIALAMQAARSRAPQTDAEAVWKPTLLLKALGAVSAFGVVVALLALTAITVAAPIFGNDSLEYASIGRLIAETRSMEHYPFLHRDFTGGIITPWTHPPAQVVLFSLAFMSQGDVSDPSSVKLLGPYFAFAQALIACAFAARGADRNVGYIAALLTLSAPILFDTTIQNHLDTMRLATFTAAIAAVWLVIKYETTAVALIAGLACACSGFTHSLGVLTLGLALPAYCILSRSSLLVRTRNILIMSAVGISFILPTLIMNMHLFGNPIQDQAPAWALPNLRFEEYLELDRGLETPFRRLMFGLLRPFTEPELYGWAFSALAIGVLAIVAAFARRIRPQDWLKRTAKDPAALCVLVVGGFFAALALTVAADSISAIKNARYPATILPLAAIAAARLLAYSNKKAGS